MAGQPSRQDEPAGFDKGPFKVCDLCGALNHITRPECFVCSWHGHFTTDPESVYQAALRRRAAPGGTGQAPEEPVAVAPPRPPVVRREGLFARLRLLIRRFLGRPPR
jgi:hypothetical protein